MNKDAELLFENVPVDKQPEVKEIVLESGEVVEVNPSGTLRVSPGQNPNKPLLRNISNGRVVKGGGRHPKANDIAAVSKRTAYKRSKTYREAIERAIPFENPDARYSLERLIDAAFNAADGSPQYVRCENCQHMSVKVLKQDGTLIFKLIELLVGQAPRTIEVSGGVDLRIQEIMNKTVQLDVHEIPQEEVEARTQALLESGVIDAEWLELDEDYQPVEADAERDVD